VRLEVILISGRLWSLSLLLRNDFFVFLAFNFLCYFIPMQSGFIDLLILNIFCLGDFFFKLTHSFDLQKTKLIDIIHPINNFTKPCFIQFLRLPDIRFWFPARIYLLHDLQIHFNQILLRIRIFHIKNCMLINLSFIILIHVIKLGLPSQLRLKLFKLRQFSTI
jgi:hypothetical protein